MNYKNLTKCDKCNLMLIFEETSLHECLNLTDYFVIGDRAWLCDGFNYYPLKLINRNFTGRKSTSDYTEPVLRFCQLHGSYD